MTLSNVAGQNQTNAEAAASPPLDEEPFVFSIPYLFAVSNSRPTLVSSNADGYAIMYSRTYTQGPLFWPGLGILVTLILFAAWKGMRRREEG